MNENAMNGSTCCCVTKKVGLPQQIDDQEFSEFNYYPYEYT